MDLSITEAPPASDYEDTPQHDSQDNIADTNAMANDVTSPTDESLPSKCTCTKVITKDVACQTKYDKHIQRANIETMVLKNQAAVHNDGDNGGQKATATGALSIENTKDDG